MGMRFKNMHDPTGNASRTGHKTPGPASYKVGQDRGKSLLNSRGPAYTIGTRPSGRRQRVGDTGGPGPGEYTGLREAGDSWGGEQKGFSLGKRLNRDPGDAGKRASGGPGPAKYNLRTNRTQGPSFTMGGGGGASGRTRALGQVSTTWRRLRRRWVSARRSTPSRAG